ncbi:hypothetical protein [Halorhodospira halochloris]|nr:hypothetical protein [Halorhodospira halochloris]MCG5547723.1 hypothetical protein [Halorhodospira halochloris]
MNPSLEASWRHPWRQDLYCEAVGLSGEFLEAPMLLITYQYLLFAS